MWAVSVEVRHPHRTDFWHGFGRDSVHSDRVRFGSLRSCEFRDGSCVLAAIVHAFFFFLFPFCEFRDGSCVLAAIVHAQVSVEVCHPKRTDPFGTASAEVAAYCRHLHFMCRLRKSANRTGQIFSSGTASAFREEIWKNMNEN